jgi:hypothetical protein
MACEILHFFKRDALIEQVSYHSNPEMNEVIVAVEARRLSCGV